MKNRLFLLLFSVLFASLIFAGAVSAYYDGSVYRVEKVSSYPDGSERTAYYEKRTDYGYQGYLGKCLEQDGRQEFILIVLIHILSREVILVILILPIHILFQEVM